MDPPAHAFFKIILNSERVEIPKDFVSKMPGSLATGTIFLRDLYNNTWPVKVSRDGDEWYLDAGWANFFRRNCLEFGDFMTFEHKGGNMFDFKLYGLNGCGKKGADGPGMPRVKKEEPMDYEHEEDQKQEEKPLDGFDSVKEEEQSLDDEYDFHNVKMEGEDNDDNGFADDDDDGDDDVADDGMMQVNSRDRASSSKVHKTKSKKIKPQGQKGTGYWYGEDIFESGLARRPQNVPYFVSRSRLQARKNELYIPKEVVADYKLVIPKAFPLFDEVGRDWEVNVKKWKDGRIWCTKGWKELCNVNRIKNDDACICECMCEEGSNKLLHIRVRRVPESRGIPSFD